MKIFQIIARLNVGGPARQIIWLTQKFQNAEFNSVLIAGTVPDGEEDMSYLTAAHGVKPIFIPELSRELSAKDIVSLFKIYREIRRQNPDIIHTHTAKAGTVGRIAAFMYRWLTLRTLIGKPRPVKIIHTFHGHVFHSYYGAFKTRIFITIERILALLATHKIIVITDQQYREIHEHFGVGSAGQFAIVPLGIDLSVYDQNDNKRSILRNEVGANKSDIVVGFVGRLTEIKNIPLLLETAAKYKDLADTDKPQIKFAIIGDGNLRESLEAQAKTLRLNNIVHFLGNREDIVSILAGTDIVALTSNNEGTPLSLIEAMAAGKPVISTAVGGVVDLLGNIVDPFDGFTVCERGVAVEPDNPEHFINGLIYLAKNEKLQESCAINGKRFVTEKYSVSRLETDIIELYRDLVKND